MGFSSSLVPSQPPRTVSLKVELRLRLPDMHGNHFELFYAEKSVVICHCSRQNGIYFSSHFAMKTWTQDSLILKPVNLKLGQRILKLCLWEFCFIFLFFLKYITLSSTHKVLPESSHMDLRPEGISKRLRWQACPQANNVSFCCTEMWLGAHWCPLPRETPHRWGALCTCTCFLPSRVTILSYWGGIEDWKAAQGDSRVAPGCLTVFNPCNKDKSWWGWLKGNVCVASVVPSGH